MAGAPTAPSMARESSMTARRSLASQPHMRKLKLKAVWRPSRRTYAASRSGVSAQASATKERSPGNWSATLRQPRYISCTSSRSQCGWSRRCRISSRRVSGPVTAGSARGGRSGSSGCLTRPWATSMRKPSTPRLNQNRRIDSNSVRTSGCCQLRSGCSGANRWRYQSPSGSRVQAGPPKQDTQSFGGSAPSGPRAGAEDVALAFRAARSGRQRRLEPGVLVGGVVGHDVGDDADPVRVRFGDEPLGVGQGAEARVDGAESATS
ncbi:hypothetical protein SVIOM74S_02236 [Streptomyces violarus]